MVDLGLVQCYYQRMKDRTVIREYTYEPTIINGKRVFSPCYGPTIPKTEKPIIKRVKKKGKKQRHHRRKTSYPYVITSSRAHISLKA